MQVKQEICINEPVDNSHRPSTILPSVNSQLPSPPSMQCLASCDIIPEAPPLQLQEKPTSTISLWSDYFDTFSTEFDLRSGTGVSGCAGGAGSTGSSIASSTSSPVSESWSSPASSGSPFSDSEQDDSAFIDAHSVPTSVIDEIVQTLKMDGYNFDHLGDDIMEISSSTPSCYVKQEYEYQNQNQTSCYISNPVYTNLNPPKLQLHLDNIDNSNHARKQAIYANNPSTENCDVFNNSNNNVMHNSCMSNGEMTSVFDQMMEGKWCNGTATALPPMSKFHITSPQPNKFLFSAFFC